MVLFGDVRELKIDREGSDYSNRFVEVESGEDTLEPALGREGAASSKALAEGPDSLLDVEEPLAAEPPQRRPEQVAEQVDVVAEGLVARARSHRVTIRHGGGL